MQVPRDSCGSSSEGLVDSKGRHLLHPKRRPRLLVLNEESGRPEMLNTSHKGFENQSRALGYVMKGLQSGTLRTPRTSVARWTF